MSYIIASARAVTSASAMCYRELMQTGPKIAEIAGLVGDSARANMLTALMGGSALTATELAYFAHITPQTASGHLGRLVDSGILTVVKQGRHRYFRLASPLIGRMIEGIMAVAHSTPAKFHPHWRGGEDLHFARGACGPNRRRSICTGTNLAHGGRRRGYSGGKSPAGENGN
jgi:DNA-binding transcriptional ArsR family regulator